MEKNDVIASLLELPEFEPDRKTVKLPRLNLVLELQEVPYNKLVRIRREEDAQLHLILAAVVNHPELRQAEWYHDKEGCATPVDALKKLLRMGEVEKLCREKDLLLIVDEVQTGIGRTGSLFCFQQYGIRPDVVTMAKGLGGGLPIGAVLAAGNCSTVLGPGTHASTFGGSPTVCAAANAVLAKVNNPVFLEKVRSKGEYIRQNLQAMKTPAIKGVRGMGLMIGIEVEAGKQGEYVNRMLEKGVLALTAGSSAVRLLPPLTITIEEIDEALKVMKDVFGAA